MTHGDNEMEENKNYNGKIEKSDESEKIDITICQMTTQMIKKRNVQKMTEGNGSRSTQIKKM